MKTNHYTPTRASDGTWGFTTPVGECPGFFSEDEAKRAAGRTEASDRAAVLKDTSPFVELLRPHFFPGTEVER